LTPEPGPQRDVDLVLHIGSGKTGTTSIQNFLHLNRERLAELGHLYPKSPGAKRHLRLGLFVKPDSELDGTIVWSRQRFSDPTAFRRSFRRKLFAEINDSGLSHVILSDEALYGSSNEAIRRLRTFTDRNARRLRLVLYLRRQDDHLSSRYQQVVKTGEVRRLAERTKRLDLSSTYDYHTRLSTWQRLVEPTEFVVRRFERDSFVDGSLFQDFLDAAGVDVRADDLEQVEPRNESLDAEAVEFLRLLNIHRVETEGAEVGRIDNRKLIAPLSAGSTGPTLTLPEGMVGDFMALWEDSNRAVAREFLGDESGQLFRSGRKTRNTTAEQVLDPSRIDHFVTMLELPQEWQGPLRRLAEREAMDPWVRTSS